MAEATGLYNKKSEHVRIHQGKIHIEGLGASDTGVMQVSIIFKPTKDDNRELFINMSEQEAVNVSNTIKQTIKWLKKRKNYKP